MKEEIFTTGEFVRMSKISRIVVNIEKEEKELFKEVESFENHMNECDCNNRYKYSFINTIDENEVHIFCLNCGGYIESTCRVGGE